MKYTKLYLFLSLLIVLFGSCAGPKKVLYFQDINGKVINLPPNYEPKIKIDDLLNILVSAPDKSVVQPFNLTISENFTSVNDPARSVIPYLVDINGEINFPIIGKIKVAGMTRRELTNLLIKDLTAYIKDPIVSISYLNYRITVLGEVRNPGTYTMTSEKTSILQALGMAGDLTISAKRNDVLLIREADGVQQHIRIDLRNSDILSSPYYYLSQNDVIYVAPMAGKIAVGTSTGTVLSTVFSFITTAIAVMSLTIK